MTPHILVTNTFPIRDGHWLVTACTVKVRDIPEANTEDAGDVEFTVRMKTGVFDRGAGEFVSFIARAEIDEAIAKIRARWGSDLPVQMNLPGQKIR